MILMIAKQHNLSVVEDCAHAVDPLQRSACWNNRGLWLFSFYANKNISTGEGGMVTTKKATDFAEFPLCRYMVCHLMHGKGLVATVTNTMILSALGTNIILQIYEAALAFASLKKLTECGYEDNRFGTI